MTETPDLTGSVLAGWSQFDWPADSIGYEVAVEGVNAVVGQLTAYAAGLPDGPERQAAVAEQTDWVLRRRATRFDDRAAINSLQQSAAARLRELQGEG